MTRPWRLEAGAFAGVLIGAIVWGSQYEAGRSLFHDLHLLVIPAAVGMLAVDKRNKRKQVGPYHPNTIERNRKGRP